MKQLKKYCEFDSDEMGYSPTGNCIDFYCKHCQRPLCSVVVPTKPCGAKPK